jgi:hypothetical protein
MRPPRICGEVGDCDVPVLDVLGVEEAVPAAREDEVPGVGAQPLVEIEPYGPVLPPTVAVDQLRRVEHEPGRRAIGEAQGDPVARRRHVDVGVALSVGVDLGAEEAHAVSVRRPHFGDVRRTYRGGE